MTASHRQLMNLWLATHLLILLVMVIGCSAKRTVTVEQVNKIVSNSLPIGSSKEEVTAFIESLKIDSVRIVHDEDFGDVAQLRWDNFDEEKKNAIGDKLKAFYDAAIRDIAPSSETFEGAIRMRFYFDGNGNLLDYTIKEDTGFR